MTHGKHGDRTEAGKGPKVPTERPDKEAAARDPGPGARNRPGFDLGGAVEGGRTSTAGSGMNPQRGGETEAADAAIDRPRLTPQGRTNPDAAGSDATAPDGGVAKGQPDKAEG